MWVKHPLEPGPELTRATGQFWALFRRENQAFSPWQNKRWRRALQTIAALHRDIKVSSVEMFSLQFTVDFTTTLAFAEVKFSAIECWLYISSNF